MLITLLTTGSRGDTQPYVALGQALQKAAPGVRVRVAAFETYADFVRAAGLEFYPIRGDVAQVAASAAGLKAMAADNPLKFLLSFNTLKNFTFGLQPEFYQACEGADAVVYHPGAAIGYFAAEQLGVPSILATPFPMTPTREYPSLIFYTAPRLGRAFNWFTHRFLEQTMWFASRAPVRQFWQDKFGCAPPNFGNPFSRQTTPDRPTLISCSPHVFPRPADWPEGVHSRGYWFLDDEASWNPPADLLAFLEQGPAPVYVGFGSVGDPASAERTTRLVMAALPRAGQRGVLATGWSGMSRVDKVPDSIFILKQAPHAWLFPRMAAVVHHGGAGTTAAGLRAGVPSVVIPSGNDQPAWARRVYELGVGVSPIPRRVLTAEKLADGILSALKPETVEAARELGARIAAERGSQAAAQIILECVGRRR